MASMTYAIARRISRFPPPTITRVEIEPFPKRPPLLDQRPLPLAVPTSTGVAFLSPAPVSSNLTLEVVLASVEAPNWLLPHPEQHATNVAFALPSIVDARWRIEYPTCHLLDARRIEEQVWVSDNLFCPLGKSNPHGKRYAVEAAKQHDLFGESLPARTSQRPGELRKSYTAKKTPTGLERWEPSLWDLLLPILQPPLAMDFAGGIDFPSPLYEYQKAGVAFLVDRMSALLGDEMGTGKTVMATVAMRLLFRKGAIRGALVVCPKSVLKTWDQHLADWAPDLTVTVVTGLKSKRKVDWGAKAHVYVTNYETLGRDGPDGDGMIPATTLDRLDLVVADEAQKIKNSDTDMARAVCALKPRYRWALSGTPIENKLEDLVSIFRFVKPKLLRSDYLTPQSAKEQIQPYFLRRKKKTVMPDLPPKIRQELWLDLDDEQRQAYQQALAQGVSEIKSLGPHASRFNVFPVLQKLKQICNFAPGKTASPKVDALLDLMSNIKDSRAKVLVFSYYKAEGIDKLEPLLAPMGTVRFAGDLSDRQRVEAVGRFRTDPDISVFLATVKTAGLGMTLVEASYVVHFDHWWNPAVMWQAEDRAHRIGQDEPVNVYSLWMRDTIDERIHELLKKKNLLYEEVIGGLSEERIEGLISTDEWLGVLGIVPPGSPQEPPQSQPPEVGSPRGGGTGGAAPASVAQPRRSEVDEILAVQERFPSLDPFRFEEIVRDVFVQLGFLNARTTKRSHDQGVDIVATRVSVGGLERIAVQCKHKSIVGVEVARELLGVLQAHPELTKGFIVTSGEASRECILFCQHNGRLAVIAGLELAQRIVQFKVKI